MSGSELSMVRLARYCTGETGKRPRPKVTDTIVVIVTATQNAG
jgi:hypothetical protein